MMNGRAIPVPYKGVHVLIPRTCEYVCLTWQKEKGLLTFLRTFRWEYYPGLSKFTNITMKFLYRGRWEGQSQQTHMETNRKRLEDAYIVGLWRWRMEPTVKECRWLLEARTGKEMDSPLVPPEGTQPCPCLASRPGKPTLDFRPPEL